MKCLLAVLLCVLATALCDDMLGMAPPAHSGPTVCIEVRHNPHDRSTKVCGPMVHGGIHPRPKSSEPLMFNIPQGDHSMGIESEEAKEAEAPCAPNSSKPPSHPSFQNRPPPPQGMQMPKMDMPQPQGMLMPRMDMPQDMMSMSMMPMEFDGTGWRQAGPPCPSPNQRSVLPMHMPFGAPLIAPAHMHSRAPMPLPMTRNWGIPSLPPIQQIPPMMPPMMQRSMEDQMRHRSADEPAMMMRHQMMGMRAAEEPAKAPMTAKKESLESLLKECEEKTKMLQEKDAKITELKTQMKKKEADPTSAAMDDEKE